MVKLLKLFLLFSLLFSCSNDSEIGTTKTISFDKSITYGGTKNEVASTVVSFNDGSYAVIGYTQSIDGDIVTTKTMSQYDFWVLKFDINDNLLWQKTYGGSNDDKAYKAINTSDNGFAIVGYSKSNDGDLSSNEGFEDIWILKLDTDGNIQWQIATGFSGTDQAFSLIQTIDGGYFIGGVLDVTASNGAGNSRAKTQHAGGDYWAIKLDASGNLEWRNYFGGTNTDTCYDVIETIDGYILVGSSDSSDVDISNNKGSYDFWVLKIDKSGTLLWEKNFGGSEIDEARAITATNDGNFMIVGDTRSNNQDVTTNNGGADLWLIKITTDGNLLWEKNFGGSSFDAARSIAKTTDGGFLISGSSRSLDNEFSNQGQNDAWILKVSSDGDEEWQQIIGGSNIDFLYDAIELENGSYVAVGESSSNDGDILENKGFSDLLIIKLK